MMNTYARPVRDLRNNYNDLINLANEGNQVIITQNGREAAVLIGTEEYKDYEKFLYRQYIKRELIRAKKMSKDLNTKWLSEDEVWAGFDNSDEEMPNINLLTAMDETEQILEEYETGTRKNKAYNNAHDLIQDILNEEDEVDV